eukprot:3600313-Rhodomonas_salina.1
MKEKRDAKQVERRCVSQAQRPTEQEQRAREHACVCVCVCVCSSVRVCVSVCLSACLSERDLRCRPSPCRRPRWTCTLAGSTYPPATHVSGRESTLALHIARRAAERNAVSDM